MEGKTVRLVLAKGTAEAKVTKARPDQTLTDVLQPASPAAKPKGPRKKG
jgi:hypothetical protein